MSKRKGRKPARSSEVKSVLRAPPDGENELEAEGGDAAGEALRVCGQRRVVGPVVGGLVAHDVDDAGPRAAGVVQVRKSVREAWAAMQQRGRGLARHAPVAVGAAGDDVLLQAEDAAHAGDAVQRGDEMHLAGAGIREADIDPAAQQGVDKTFRAVHRVPLPP